MCLTFKLGGFNYILNCLLSVCRVGVVGTLAVVCMCKGQRAAFGVFSLHRVGPGTECIIGLDGKHLPTEPSYLLFRPPPLLPKEQCSPVVIHKHALLCG